MVPLPEGTRGYDDLRRHATYEAIGRGLRAQIASPGATWRACSEP